MCEPSRAAVCAGLLKLCARFYWTVGGIRTGQFGYGELLAMAIALRYILPCMVDLVTQLTLRDLDRWILIIQTTKLVWIGYGTMKH